MFVAKSICRSFAAELRRTGHDPQAETLLRAVETAAQGTEAITTVAPDDRPSQVAAAHFREALAAAPPVARQFAAQLADVEPSLHWIQTDTYIKDPPHAKFLDLYAHATILGSRPTTSLLVDHTRSAAVGVLLLAPGNVYPYHQHYADEIYYPLTRAEWSSGLTDAFAPVNPGTPLHHQPLQPHAVRADEQALACLYIWTGDTTTSAWLCGDARVS